LSGQPPPASPTPPDPARVPGVAGRATTQRRAHYRADDDQPVLVLLGSDATVVVRLTDLSESGVRLRVDAERALLLPLDQEVDLVVSLPDSNEQLRGRVVHRDPPGAQDSVVVGLAFVDQDRASADRIRRHVFAVQRELLARRRLGGT
jgi:c-di-GMP-binding flagellar brake protein YcgR